MQYVRPVDYAAFRPTSFHSQRIAESSTGVDSCRVLCTRVPPGTQTTGGLHIHDGDQFYYILTGNMNLQLGTRTFKAGPNSLVWIPRGVPHFNWNSGTEDEVHFELIVPSAMPIPGMPKLVLPQEPTPETDEQVIATYIRPLDPNGFDPQQPYAVQTLADRNSGSQYCRLNVVHGKAGASGPGLHVHRFDQFYFMISGSMHLQIGLDQYTAGPSTLVILPAGVPHRNWNDGNEDEYHIALLVPEPAAGQRPSAQVHIDE